LQDFHRLDHPRRKHLLLNQPEFLTKRESHSSIHLICRRPKRGQIVRQLIYTIFAVPRSEFRAKQSRFLAGSGFFTSKTPSRAIQDVSLFLVLAALGALPVPSSHDRDD
jgi:hypothetical protein